MTINNRQLYEDGIWDWGFLNECFQGTKIRITDIDGAVERNGKFLFIETKHPGANIPIGQEIFFNKQVKLGNSVMYVWGNKNKPQRIRVVTPHIDKTFDEASEQIMKDIVSQWFTAANSK